MAFLVSLIYHLRKHVSRGRTDAIAGVPSTANRWLLTDLLRRQWGFQGFVVTDDTSINELIPHGVAADLSYLKPDGTFGTDPGSFIVFIGGSSENTLLSSFELK